MPRALALAALLAFLAIPAAPTGAPAQEITVAEVDAEALSRFDTENPELFALLDAVGLYDILAIIAAEGAASAADMEAGMFPGRGGARWSDEVARIHDLPRLVAELEDGWPEDRLSAEDIATLHTFFTSDLGRRIVEGEVVARAGIANEAVEEAANEVHALARAEGDPRLEILEAFNEANHLIDLNVQGSLNASVSFYRGLQDGGALPAGMPEGELLAEVWAQEPQVRADTVEWLYSYQLMAYDGLEETDLEAYVALSETEAGQAYNAALFTAFDRMLEAVSYDLGRAAADIMSGEDI